MVIKLHIIFSKFLIIFLLICNNTNASTINGHELKILIENWLINNGQHANISILEEMKYPKCDESQLIINDISGNGKLIKVNCLGKNPWQFIVRNKLIEKKKIKTNTNKFEVYAFKTFKNKGTVISDDDLIKIKKKKGNNSIFVSEKTDIVGRKLKKDTKPNQPIKFTNLENNWLIEKNSLVTIINKKSFITIKEEGMALEDANYMEKIRVKNVKSGKIIVGFAKNPKKVIMNSKQY